MAKQALLIGISEYGAGFSQLPAAVKDISAMQRVLKDPEMGEFDEAKILANPDRQTMEDEIETLFSRCGREDLALLFFSGHGIKDDRGRLYFASSIARKNQKGALVRSSAVSTRFVHEIMETSRCRHQVIILDCCFSGAFDPALQAKDDGEVDLKSQLGAEGRVVLTSSSSTEYSFEQEGSDLSIYTRYLVEGIETGAGDESEDGLISALELHEYAARKVQETAPNMTPKIIVMKDKGFEIVLAKAKVTDPKLKYRKEAERYATAGQIRPAGHYVLGELKRTLGLTDEEAISIEIEVLRPFQERLANLGIYREALVAEAEHEYPLSKVGQEAIEKLRTILGLRVEDVLPIQQEIETQRAQQTEAYQANLEQYRREATAAIQQNFPLSDTIRQNLDGLQRFLGLKAKDVLTIERPLIKQAEYLHQEKLRYEAKQQRQAQERTEHEDKLRCYERVFADAIAAEYPLQPQVIDKLRQFQKQLGLNNETVAPIERALYEPAECKHRETLKLKAEAERQRKIKKQQKKITQPNKSLDLKSNINFSGSQHDTKIKSQIFEFEVVTFTDARSKKSRKTQHSAKFFSEFLGDEVVLEMVKISGKTSQIGSLVGQGQKNERPRHQVRVPAFCLSKYPVTQAQWQVVAALPKVEIELNENPSTFQGKDRPVEGVSWYEAREFCNRLSYLTGHAYRLPSEAEWEYACRAGTKTNFYFGERLNQKLAKCRANLGTAIVSNLFDVGETTNVGYYSPNAFGLYDMHGNVWEWCADCWHRNYKGAPTNGRAWIEGGELEGRVIRGGSWFSPPSDCRAATREYRSPTDRSNDLGFRVVCSVLPGLN